ncbi:peptidase MA family metallohydrolase [Humisphaera borealis]|uniref:Tetratricopeptide repeat protein n=1 Tax=Humisphaera borealis TaxID=2807512 RepID=A0A7M2WRX6_9BACT|nr:peptidase MA family metallohydrolase [Humisphaera borealis]QOV88295.1 hypothetical protein IPV69_18860 [Humisphaera borealis]
MLAVLATLVATGECASAESLAEARKLYETGDYAACQDAAAKGVESNRWFEEWWLLKIRTELTTGKYADALKTFEAAHQIHTFSLPLKWIGVEVLRRSGRADEATGLLQSIRELAEAAPRRLEEVSSRVAAGRAMLATGADARVVLETYYDRAKKDDPTSAEPYFASGELSLAKFDYALAAEAFAGALKRAPDSPDAHLGLALAYQESDAERATAALTKSLELNPRHIDSLLFQADNLIDREGYQAAEDILAKVLEINPRHSRAWAYRAVLAHLAGDTTKEQTSRAEALSTWIANPEVDHLIGLKLSQKYRFAEGAAYQRRALEVAQNYQPANVQLCQDLLRLGKDEEGWKRAAAALEADPYNVVAYNLVSLNDVLSKYRILENAHFRLRMDGREADLYGDRALRLLTRARERLTKRYGVEIAGPVSVEVFPKQSDFAIRTFGLPGGSGFLGVCFGPVITINSPASRMARPANWEAVLWHEFCHSVTLGKTKNKMPRWLSEGISVYEERRENAAWGQSMTPEYRELILAGGATPVSQLSGAFLKPPSPMHLQFAYYESSMVVQYIADRFGENTIGKVLADLGDNVRINDALAKRTVPIDQLDANFDAWLKEQASKLGKPGTDWKRPEVALDAGSAEMAAWNKEHPNSFYGLLGEGRALLAEEKFAAAKTPLSKAIELYPTSGQAGGPYLLMAAVHRALKEPADERRMLEKHVALDADGIEPRLRLAELAEAAGDWPAVRVAAEQIIAINPLIPAPYRLLAKSANSIGDRRLAMESHRALLMLDPLGKAEHHYQLAKLLVEEKQLPAARNQIIRALEEAPRFREGHRLLLEIAAGMDREGAAPNTRPVPAQGATQPARSQ